MDPSRDLQLPPANGSGSRQQVACPDGFWSADLHTATPREVPWLWHGYLAAGSITLWTSRWKAGKTTLLSVLLARRVTGGPLAGRTLTQGRTALVSEESREQWALRRQRALAAFSRFDDTPRDLVIELNAQGTDYEARGEAAQDEFLESWSRLHTVLALARGKLTRREIAASWPDADGPAPAEASLRRWLKAALSRGLLRSEGAGTRDSPLRYWLPEAEERWNADPMYRLLEADRLLHEQLAQLDVRPGA